MRRQIWIVLLTFVVLGTSAFAQREETRRGATSPIDLPRFVPVPSHRSIEEGAVEGDAKSREMPSPPPSSTKEDPSRLPRSAGPVADHLAQQSDLSCRNALVGLGVKFRTVAPVRQGACGVDRPYVVSEISPGVALEPEGLMSCDTALALARWVRHVVVPASEAMGEGTSLEAVSHGSAFVCRWRGGQAGQVSEHAFGRAIDITAFRLVGREPIEVRPRARDGTMEEAFQAAVRAGGCLYFTTVLGPGADESHDDHLHLDVKPRANGHRLCQ